VYATGTLLRVENEACRPRSRSCCGCCRCCAARSAPSFIAPCGSWMPASAACPDMPEPMRPMFVAAVSADRERARRPRGDLRTRRNFVTSPDVHGTDGFFASVLAST